MDCLGRWDPQVFNENIVSSTRDEILGTIVRTCQEGNVPRAISSFPGVQVLDRLLKSFLTCHANQTDSFIHIPTFRPAEARVELLIACIAFASTMSPSRPIQKLGLALQEILVFQLWIVVRTNTLFIFDVNSSTNITLLVQSEKSNALIHDLQFLQASALHLADGLWSGSRRKMEMSGSFIGIITNVLELL